MKKIISLMLALVMVFSLAACGEGTKKANNDASGITKVGLGTSVVLTRSKGKSDDGPVAGSDTTIAGLAFDKDGKIVKAIFDVAQDIVSVDDEGKVQTVEEFKTKKELKEDYNMKATSEEVGIGKEWYEQAGAFEDYVVGKTADEVLNFEVDDEGKGKDEDLLAGTTISIAAFQKAVKDAWENAQEAEGVKDIGLGVYSSLGHRTKDKDDEGGAAVQFEDNISLIALDKDGKIVASQTDVAQNTIPFTADGELDGNLNEGTTKRGLGDKYNMRATSEETGIGKEWYEQAEAYDKYLVGKAKDEVSKIELGEDGKAKDEDLLAGATISLSDFVKATTKATENTK